jgi:hypothetical protein
LKEKQRKDNKGGEDEKEDISSYRMTIKQEEYSRSRKRNKLISLSGELALEETMDLSEA